MFRYECYYPTLRESGDDVWIKKKRYIYIVDKEIKINFEHLGSIRSVIISIYKLFFCLFARLFVCV